MKNILFLLFLLLSKNVGYTQSTGTWTWENGSNSPIEVGNYGQKGIENPTNVPGARGYSCSWTDKNGNFWIFGGTGIASTTISNNGMLNDLWKWNGSVWTWVSGDSTSKQKGIYGTMGVPASTNVPGSRYGSVCWNDKSGNFWLFGGSGYDVNDSSGYLNDLWKWDGTDWTWVSGANVVNLKSVYGSKGIAAPSNMPGCRIYGAGWADNQGNLWMFGGSGYGYWNDLWKWDGTNWTWVKGDSVQAGVFGPVGVYGIKGMASPSNIPGSRISATTWTDSAGNFWLFGGLGIKNGLNYMNDLWKWDGINWTWVSGNSSANQSGIYGLEGLPSALNMPGSREESTGWIDKKGNLYLFGGDGYDITNSHNTLTDLWKWDGNNWTWISGSNTANQYGQYGSEGRPAQGNVPGCRYSASGWVDNSNNLWLFGGVGLAATGNRGYLNDLWKFNTAATILPITLTAFKAVLSGHETDLTWSTSTETNNAGFYIERSDDSKNFKQLGFNLGRGTSNNRSDYTFVDPQPLNGHNLYRLKQIDLDGHYTYSSIIEIDNAVEMHDLKIYPSPASNNIYILTTESRGILQVMDITGRAVKTCAITGSTTQIDISMLPSGT